MQLGFETNASTIYWWLKQDKQAQESISKVGRHFDGIIHELNTFFKKAKNVWSHATFDWVILMNHYNKLNVKPSCHYTTARDLRTLVDLANVEYKNVPRKGTHHNALDDCKFQVQYAVECFNKLKKSCL
jgi:hypothetical protein